MFGDTTRADFTGLEGPDDPAQVALFAYDPSGEPIAILHTNTAHPTAFYGRDFYSADFPGVARRVVREALDAAHLPVLFFNGAFGDIANGDLLSQNPWQEPGERVAERQGHLLAAETLRLLHGAAFHDEAPLACASEELTVPVRLPDPARVAWARETLAKVEAGEEVEAWDRMFAYGTTLLQDGFGDDPVDQVPVGALRVGDLGFAMEPCELYCQFGLDIKRRSPAPHTAILGQINAALGYCPTLYGTIGGGYSGEPLDWTRYTPELGYRMVDACARLLHKLWRTTG
jgi:hypothetical protein